MSAFQSFADFVTSDVWINDEGPDRVFRPQAFWLAEQSSNQLLVDRVLRLESLDAELHELLLAIGAPRSKLPSDVPRLNATRTTDVADVLPNELLDRIRARYRRDLDMFQYSIPAPGAEGVPGRMASELGEG
jgi:hypothetical protein